jgi:hypothetical protein
MEEKYLVGIYVAQVRLTAELVKKLGLARKTLKDALESLEYWGDPPVAIIMEIRETLEAIK